VLAQPGARLPLPRGSVGREIARRGAEYALWVECMVLLMGMFVVKTGMKVNM
jgi:hypothetical protein